MNMKWGKNDEFRIFAQKLVQMFGQKMHEKAIVFQQKFKYVIKIKSKVLSKIIFWTNKTILQWCGLVYFIAY